MSEPLVSVVIPSFNQGRYIDETLRSVFAQDYPNVEVLVLDGASRDNTVQVLERYDGRPGFWWKSEPDRGVVDAVNQGLARARGEICGILSSDDCYLPGAIRSAVDAFVRDPGLGLVYGEADYIDARGAVIGRSNVGRYSLERLLSRRCYIVQSSAFFRTTVGRQAGAWRDDVAYAADNDLWLRIAFCSKATAIPATWSLYRFHDEQRDTQSSRIVRDWRRVVTDLSPQLDRRQRRYARVGCHLTEYRYAPRDRWWQRTTALYAAVLTLPTCVFWSEFPRLELLQPARQLLSRVKRAVLGLRHQQKRPTHSQAEEL